MLIQVFEIENYYGKRTWCIHMIYGHEVGIKVDMIEQDG